MRRSATWSSHRHDLATAAYQHGADREKIQDRSVFEFLTDEGNVAAQRLGIENRDGLPMGVQMMGYDSDTVLPTVVITDKQGKIIWTYETNNYRIRPDTRVYLEVMRRNGIVPEAA